MAPLTIRDLGSHRLLGVLRHGERLAVCTVVHRQSGAQRLAKVLLPGKGPISMGKRFAHQAQRLQTLLEPGLIATFDAGVLPSGAAFVVTEPVQGISADEWLRRTGPLGDR